MVKLKSRVLGVLLLVGIGLTARAVASVLPLNYLIVAILLGLLIGNSYGIPKWARAGVVTHKLWLEAGIVVMGASIAFDQILAAGPILLMLVIGTVGGILLTVEMLARYIFDLPETTGSLLAAGSGICGVSAVVTVAGSIEAREQEIAYAAATVLLFDAATLFVYPIVGNILGLSDVVFGIWAGLTMFSTGPVAAAGFSFSQTAGEWALLVKLTRNAFIGVAAVVYAVYYARQSKVETGSESNSEAVNAGYLWRSFPKFVLGFLVVMLIANTGVFGSEQLTSLEHASDWLFLLAFAGLGLEIQLSEIRSTGLKPIVVVLISLLIISVVELLILTSIFP